MSCIKDMHSARHIRDCYQLMVLAQNKHNHPLRLYSRHLFLKHKENYC